MSAFDKGGSWDSGRLQHRPVSACLPKTPLSLSSGHVAPVHVWACAPMHLEHLPRLQCCYWETSSSLHPASGCSLASLSVPTQHSSALFADAIGLQPDARGVATSLGLNERLFVVNPQEVHELVGPGRAPGPREGLFWEWYGWVLGDSHMERRAGPGCGCS